MLEGIEILNQTEITTKLEWISIAGIISFILMFVFIVLTVITVAQCDNNLWVVMYLLAFFSLFISVYFIALDKKTNVPTGKYEYQVTINNSVSMTEFYEKYEIVEVEGKIYTIREKEQENEFK